MKKKNITNQVSNHSRIVANAGRVIMPPAHVPLDEEDKPFFENVIKEFARAEWTDHALELAALLARTLCDMERESRALRGEGSISYSEKGTPVPNPRKTIVQMHAGTVLSLRKSLGMDARSKAEGKDIASGKKAARSLEEGAQSLIADSLIAYPSMQ